jgi:catechol 1,2-dioxygenase/hydroxyquinol 1,2-dioxygenase
MATDLGPETLTSAVLESFSATPDPRLKQILASLTTHLHAFVRDVHPSIEEWEYAVNFLTATGQMSDESRQEFILLSDVLGISMLVETLNHEETPDATDPTVLGPFHVVESPVRQFGADISAESTGDACLVHGTVRSPSGEPIAGATVDIWQANAEGFYDVQQPGVQSVGNGRGLFTTNADGEFAFTSIVPSYYPIPTDGPVGVLLDATRRHPNRPAHIHFLVKAHGFTDLTTHIFVAGSPYIDSDAVFAVKESLVTDFVTSDDAVLAERFGLPTPFADAAIGIVLEPVDKDDQ